MEDLIKFLPDFYDSNSTMAELQGILTEQIKAVLAGRDTAVNECFVKTAIGLLTRYEEICGIKAMMSDSAAVRRERITAKYIGSGTTTKKLIEDVAAAFSNGEVEVTEDNSHYRFTIKFISQVGTPPGIEALKAQIEMIKPAHLQVTYEIIYRTHRELKAYTYTQLTRYTHSAMREETL